MKTFLLHIFISLLGLFIVLFHVSCTQDILGVNRSTRMSIYGDIINVAGHPEIGEPLKAVARELDKQPKKVTP